MGEKDRTQEQGILNRSRITAQHRGMTAQERLQHAVRLHGLGVSLANEDEEKEGDTDG